MAAQNSVVVQIARPYATALFDLARDDNRLDAVEAGLRQIAGLLDESDEFSAFLRSPVIPADVKARAVDAILLKAGAEPIVANAVRLVAQNGRLFALPQIISRFLKLAAEARGEMAAEVTSAAPLTDAQRRSLADAIKARIGKAVTLTEHVDPALIGGLRVQVGSQMIDSSLQTKLNAMKIAMKEVG